MAGLYFDEFQIGQKFVHDVTRTVTETDNLLFTVMTHNTQPLHLDAEYAKGAEFGQILVNSIFTFGLMIGASITDTTLGTTVANLGMDGVKFPKPVFIGDTVTLEAKIVEILPKNVARVSTVIKKQTGEVVMDGEAKAKLPDGS